LSVEGDREKVITLVRPVEHAGGTISEIRLRAPTIAEYRRAMQGPSPIEQTIGLVSVVSGIGRDALEKMDVDAVLEANDFLMGFIDRGRRTGES